MWRPDASDVRADPDDRRRRAGLPHRHRYAGQVSGMRSFLRTNGLTLFFLVILVLALAGQAVSGVLVFNARQLTSGGAEVSLTHYLTSSQFAVDVAENWQSEFLQFFLYIFVTVWLVQRGSPESKKPDEAGTESPERQKIGEHAREDSPRWAAVGGWRTAVFARS